MEPMYLSIQPEKTGERIRKLLMEQGYTIREIQGAFGFENPQAIYKWLSGKSLPSIDNFIILSRLLHTTIEDILVIDGDISNLWNILNCWLNDKMSSYDLQLNQKQITEDDGREDDKSWSQYVNIFQKNFFKRNENVKYKNKNTQFFLLMVRLMVLP